jgi:diguanylate cyclase
MPQTLPDDVRHLVERDSLHLLYAQAPGSILISAAAAIGLVLSAGASAAAAGALWWGAAFLFMMFLRALLFGGYGVKMRRGGGDSEPLAVQRWSLAYRALVLTAGALFALWPLLFFPEMDPLHRLTSTVILGSLAGGSIAILSIERGLALAYGALIILSYSVMLIAIGGFGERVCGYLGLLYMSAMVFSVGRTHRSIIDSLVLSHRNAGLAERLNAQSRDLQEANTSLAAAQDDLRQTNTQLEQRILERTVELQRLATRDSLTGLANRSRLAELAETHLVQREDAATLFFVDLDGFKEINDTMGHAVGDLVLTEVAARLVGHAGEVHALSRWGGDEFVILRSSDGDHDEEMRYAERLRTALQAPMQGQPQTVRINACIGVAHWPRDGKTLQELIDSADLAVYSAKAQGRGVIRAFDDALAEQGRRQLELRKTLARQLEQDCPDFRLVYQPIYDVAGSRLSGVEALLRWHHPQLGEVSPVEFVPLAERSGDMVELGIWVLREACRFGAGFDRAQLPSVCVNVSVQQLLSANFVQDLTSILRDAGLEGDRLTLELTESVFISDYEHIAGVFRRIDSLGVHIAIDDFGTGYSSLSYLQRLPADILKIDGSFVRALDDGGLPIIDASVSLARAFGMKVVAEGIEQPSQLETLIRLGADSVQGFLLGMPEDGATIRRRLSEGMLQRLPAVSIAATG